MQTTKLTLSADADIIAAAKRTAARKHTSVSRMFARFIIALQESPAKTVSIGPVTQRASGLVKLPKQKTDRQLIEDALTSRYGSDG